MATLVLGAVGTLVGGPIGGAIGSLLGNGLDRALFGGARARGPRLGDLAVQSSSYGARVPALFGTMRVAGTVIWATDLREERGRGGGGKLGGGSTTYSYSASLAVALSARPIAGIGRIWADGKLLRGAAGDWKTDSGFRLYLGQEDQPVDPLIAAAEGIGRTPAYRGLAYAVFEDLQLADFGNRIPSLTFEVTADAAPLSPAAIAVALTGGQVAGDPAGPLLGGFAATGDSVADALTALVAACPLPLADDGAVLRVADPMLTPLPDEWAGAGAGDAQPRRVRDRTDTADLPDAVALRYYEPARDYQAGLQRARRDGVAARERMIDLPAALPADIARALAAAALQRAWTERDEATLHLPWRALPARVGTLVALADGSRWRIAGWTLERMALALRLRRVAAASAPRAGADAGRAVPPPDLVAGRTALALMDLPALDDTLAAAPGIWLAAAGTAPGWRRADLLLTLDGGASWRAVGGTGAPAVIGATAEALASGPTGIVDRSRQVDVALLHDGMVLAGADADGLAAGVNLALLGDELVQFGQAVQVAPTRWRLGALLRGVRGTVMADHPAGARFVLLDPAALVSLPVPLAALGGVAGISALGPGDAGVAARADLPVVGRALRPPSPVALTARRLADGTVAIGWTRRSRLGWAWLDGGEVPLGEDGERYRLVLRPSVGAVRTVEVTSPAFFYTPAMQQADGAAAANGLAVEVAMLGTIAASDPPATAQWHWQGASQ